MPRRPHSPSRPAVAALATLLACTGVWAEKADRSKPLVVESDGRKAASVDLVKRTTTVIGNVVITQGTMQIKADRVEVREDAPGRFSAVALGSASQPATFRQKRDRVDEFVEAQGLRIDYDGAADRVRLSGEARMRVLRGGQPADEASAAVIVYDQPSDTLTFEGAAPTAGASAPAGRPRLVFVPRSASAPAASEAPR